MLNYANLSDVEFEWLCCDIMQKKLGRKLRIFGKGKDGGIDLTDNIVYKNIIVQVKHYIDPTSSTLINALKKELEKVNELKPKQYYICCSKNLTPQNVADIYNMFKSYMSSDANIITLNEIEVFLTNKKNEDILLKHYKLWLDSTGILEIIGNRNIFIDCEVLLSNIHNDQKFFVETSAFKKCLACLSKNKVLFITGKPGVGKTITSKMLVMYYAAKGYIVRYTSNSSDLKELKKSLTIRPEINEIILVDDCLGQAYFEMKKSQNEELISLIKFVNLSKNKLLILNSRVTIFQEAKEQKPELVKSLENEEYRVLFIDMNTISYIEKAKILYNHLYFNKISNDYFNEIKKDQRYFEIIRHKNYNPRIIEFITNSHRTSNISVKEYYTFIINQLNNPKEIWKDEYERRLQKVDRLFLSTLYSLTDKEVEIQLLRDCFEIMICPDKNIDKTINQFEAAQIRLLDGFIKIIDKKGTKMISMVNPSINDYFSYRLRENKSERKELLANILHIWQFNRLVTREEFGNEAIQLIYGDQLKSLIFETNRQRNAFIVYAISVGKICDYSFCKEVYRYLTDITDLIIQQIVTVKFYFILNGLFSDNLYAFYNIHNFIFEGNGLEQMLFGHDIEDTVEIINIIYNKITNEFEKDKFIEIATEALKTAIMIYCDDFVDVSELDIDINSIINSCYTEYGDVNERLAEDRLLEKAIDEILDNINFELSLLPDEIKITGDFISNLNISVSGIDEAIYENMRPGNDIEEDYYFELYDKENEDEIEKINNIFDRF